MSLFNEHIQHLLRFLIVGVISTIVNYAIFLLLMSELGWQYQLSSICGFIIGVGIGFPLNKAWTYKNRKNIKSVESFYKYGIVYLVSMVVNAVFLGLLVQKLKLDPQIANIITIAITTIVNFIGTKFWAFRSSSKNHPTNNRS